MNSFDLNTYLNNGIEKIISDILRASAHNPKETAFMMKFIASSRSSGRIRAGYEADGIHIPPFLIASITDSCNLHCQGCYARANHICGEPAAAAKSPDAEILTVQRWSEIFTEASDLGISFILLAGGEPLMRPEILEAAADHKKILFPVFTNGTLFTENTISLFHRNRNLIPVISIEGSRRTTDARRGSGTYDKLKTTMTALSSRKVLFAASVTVTNSNIDEVFSAPFIDMLSQSGCKGVIYVEYVPVSPASAQLAPDDKTREIIMQKLDALRTARRDMVFIAFPGDEKRSGGCLAAGRGFFHINPRGGAEPCPFSPYSDVSLRTTSLRDALASPLFTRLRSSGIMENEHAGGCTLFEQEDRVKEFMEAGNE